MLCQQLHGINEWKPSRIWPNEFPRERITTNLRQESFKQMDQNLIYFAHGQEGTPQGSKILRLGHIAEKRGFKVISPDYRGIIEADKRLEKLLKIAPATKGRLVLVGSSMGAYISVVASSILRPDGLFLLAPAVFLVGKGYSEQNPVSHARVTVVVHGWQDDVVPPENVFRFAQKQHIPLHMLNSGHRLLDVMESIEKIFGFFLDEVLGGDR